MRNFVVPITTGIESFYQRHGLHTPDRQYHQRDRTLLVTAGGDSLRDDLFQEKAGKASSREISRSAWERKMGSMDYAEVMLSFYNKKARCPLRWAQLHELQSQRAGAIGKR